MHGKDVWIGLIWVAVFAAMSVAWAYLGYRVVVEYGPQIGAGFFAGALYGLMLGVMLRAMFQASKELSEDLEKLKVERE